jgi:hypothetical protein
MTEDGAPEPPTRGRRTCATLIALAIVLCFGTVAVAGWYLAIPHSVDLATVADVSRLPLTGNARLLQSSFSRFPWESVYAHLRMTAEQFERFQSEIDFELTRDAAQVTATVDVMRWYHGDEPDWWAPESLADPLAAWASRPAAPESATWSRWVAIVARERTDGSVEMYLHATQDP